MARARCRAMTDRHLRYVCQGESLPQPHLLCLRSVLFIRDHRDPGVQSRYDLFL